MIYDLQHKNNRIEIRYNGQTNKDLSNYLNTIHKLKYKKFSWDNHCHYIDYKHQNYLQVMTDQVQICSDLKYIPYQYQKEIIGQILDQDNTLLISPCGSGKTMIGIGTFSELRKRRQIKNHEIGIILVKATLKLQWYNEVLKFSNLKPSIIKTYSDIASYKKTKINQLNKEIKKYDKIKDRKIIKELKEKVKELEKQAHEIFAKQFKDCDLLIINYESLKEQHIHDYLLSMKNIKYIFADEIQKISNRKAQISKAAFDFNYIDYKIGATATAINNNPENIYALYHFIKPELFPNFQGFAQSFIRYAGYGRVAGTKNEVQLIKKYSNHIIVITKDEISDQLPALNVIQYYCDLTKEQQEMNEFIMQQLKELKDKEFEISSKAKSEKDLENNPEYQGIKTKILMLQTFAQELCDMPELLNISESEIAKTYSITNKTSPKTALLLDLVDEIINSNEKVAIVSRYVSVQNLLYKILTNQYKFKIATLNGSMSDEERYKNIYTRFRDDPEYKILLLSDAGSTGVNMSKCQYFIEYDLAESYALQTQRHGRIERADSIYKNAFVYQLIARNSYDEIQQKIISKKENYDRTFIQVYARK